MNRRPDLLAYVLDLLPLFGALVLGILATVLATGILPPPEPPDPLPLTNTPPACRFGGAHPWAADTTQTLVVLLCDKEPNE